MATSEQTLLVIDDVEENCDMLKHRLEKADYNVEVAADGQEGFLLLSRRTINLILLDLDMPVMNGFTFLEKIKSDKNYSHIPVVITSSLDDEDTMNDCIAFGSSGFMPKPYKMDKILRHIESCLN